MNISIAFCVLKHLRHVDREIKILQKRLDESFEYVEIRRNCYLIEHHCLRKLELEKCLEYHLQEINITEPINSFAPNIYTK